MEPLLYEITPIFEKMDTVVAYVKKDANIKTMADLRGKKAAFPLFDGVAWHSTLEYLRQNEESSCSGVLYNYFSEVCAPGIEIRNVTNEVANKFTKSCYKQDGLSVVGELMALRGLLEGYSDVAFISMRTFAMYQSEYFLLYVGIGFTHLGTHH